ncbi:hypothetical protein OG601_08275 [Streptomyces sp. NBC_01239]|uniref:hypothetical protein n=1 Tax=Streptomyces sp. NBC_01239 TaxID=2903792 RepID=UPI00225C2642|nr:hypothetical protein [Streptomyces sp. NBC_01239]MCX4810617.1 hypothetical protein [Streptomyces sp. NBC_01239]
METRGHREPLPEGGLVLAVTGRPGPPPLRFETADGGRRLLRQAEHPLALGRLDGEGCCHDLALHRYDGYSSPLPPLRAAEQRTEINWVHEYARWLEDAPDGPLHDGRWTLTGRPRFTPGIWTTDFVQDWPNGTLELYCGGGWHGVLPLRRLSPPDAPRVKAYRKHARDGTLAPVLLWWVTFLDGWLVLDGHDRAVAALTEGAPPVCVELRRVPDDEDWHRTAAELTEAHAQHTRHLADRPAHQLATLERAFGDTMASLPYDPAPTLTWPVPGGAPAWDELAGRAVFECPRD